MKSPEGHQPANDVKSADDDINEITESAAELVRQEPVEEKIVQSACVNVFCKDSILLPDYSNLRNLNL